MRRTALFMAVFALLLLVPAPVIGVWGGRLDGNQHPMVGGLYADFNGDGEIAWNEVYCTGSYAGPSNDANSEVFLTAAHCLALAAARGINTFWVSFDPDPQEGDGFPEGLIQAVGFAWDPRYGNGFWGHPYDSAVVLLPAGSVTGISPVRLPPAGYLDELKRSGALQHSQIELVGYGVVPEWNEPGGTQFTFDGVRRTGFAEITGLKQPFLRFQQNPHATGLAGLCFRDSGSPNFIPGTLVVVSTTTGVAGMGCNAFGEGYRLDTPEAREFLGQYLPLP